MIEVPFTRDTVMKCICGKCPVQKNSQCSNELNEKAKMMKNGKMAESKDITALYCSSGVARCKDLDFMQVCICGECPIWSKYNLSNGEPMGYFCRDGKTG